MKVIKYFAKMCLDCLRLYKNELVLTTFVSIAVIALIVLIKTFGGES